jgi:hypothetical protein
MERILRTKKINRLLVENSPTQRAPDWWDSARQKGVHYAQTSSVKPTSSRPAHQRVTLTVRRLHSAHCQNGDLQK